MRGRKGSNFKPAGWRLPVAALSLVALLLVDAGCFLSTTVEPYYGRVVVPRSQEFRWSDGGLPQTFDPAFAAAPPDTDLVRAIFEGLTDYDPRTLAPVPAVATRWESSADARVWTFYLRADALWSNGEPVTAADFVRSWQRTLRLGELAPHTDLLGNIVGAEVSVEPVLTQPGTQSNTARNRTLTSPRAPDSRGSGQTFGAEAVNEHVLRVRLQHPDRNFPALVAHPVFRPVKLSDGQSLAKISASATISNGAFVVAKTDLDAVMLERAGNYWGKQSVQLDRVRFVGAPDAETALTAYRAGEIDVVTNAAFEPLALKLLAPYKDFRRATFGALTYYSFNLSKAPFADARVREALAIAIDRERISQDELGGATEPARKFIPDAMPASAKPGGEEAKLLERDVERARALFAAAGYADGKGFPRVRLLINRNEQQRLVAQSIAATWRSALNIDTEVIVKSWDEYEAALRAGDYDVVRRGLVMQTTDELTNIKLLFQPEIQVAAGPGTATQQGSRPAPRSSGDAGNLGPAGTPGDKRTAAAPPVETEVEALASFRAMPIYFASSYALVKPYVVGLESNVLDAPSLKSVRIDTQWKQPRTQGRLW